MNFEELVSAVKQKFPKYEWEVVDLPYNNLTVLSKILASSKLWFTPCGSNVNNVIFMQPNTCMCVQMCNIFDGHALKQIQTMGVIAVVSRVQKGEHYHGPIFANIEAAINSIKYGIVI